MEEERLSLEDRVERIAVQLDALSRRVDQLALGMETVRARSSQTGAAYGGEEEGDASEELLSWVGKSSLLQRLSTLCFLLVVALVLRTVTEAGVINLQIGSVLGMVYAALLMFMGWRRYQRENPLAPIFTICGAALLFTIVVEAHAHFESLPSVPAYILLMVTGLGMAALSYFYRAPAPIAVGTLGMCLAGTAIDYPHPFFPYLGGLLITANLLGYFAARAHKYSWLRWILLLVTMFMIHLWGFKLGVTILGKETMPDLLAPSFFLPVLSLFALTYPATAFLRIMNHVEGRLARFDLLAPVINVSWAFTLARYVVFSMGGNNAVLGMVGVIAGLTHLGLAFWIVTYKKPEAKGANAFVFAGSLLLTLALPVVTGGIMSSLPLLAAGAFGLAVLSDTWQSGGVRWTSYLLQTYAAIALASLLLVDASSAHPVGGTLAAALLACLGLLHYKWCRANTPAQESIFFSKIDKSDFSAVMLLLGSLLSAFFLLRIVVHEVLVFLLPTDAVGNALKSAQSVIINVSAAVLMLFALAHRKKEVRNVALFVTIIGAIKVFLYDMIGGMHGLPLVISVFSFGLATALESFGLTRWHHLVPQVDDMVSREEP
ncbi:MAG: DUF2339 domain-containing protein [Syntrophales bacterium LBB04]|nr:DUF2339 domain-containing protein [Syntrophales bacterium LBB04]